ncbi:MAG: hydrogenase maturation nickel metallochaperone HypA [Thermodesulfovibrio sp.]|nr:hydrogenase maturation nickel metallochaperone HypA [Thermodesulfovibrio sp.]
MHEVSIAQSLLEIAINNCKNNGFSRIGNIKVLIGKASGVMPDALFFAFDGLKADTIASEATLEIEEVPVSGFCNLCNKDFTTDEKFILACPHCDGLSYTLNSGRELNITEMEVF